jgi:hypothetical protein
MIAGYEGDVDDYAADDAHEPAVTADPPHGGHSSMPRWLRVNAVIVPVFPRPRAWP